MFFNWLETLQVGKVARIPGVSNESEGFFFILFQPPGCNEEETWQVDQSAGLSCYPKPETNMT